MQMGVRASWHGCAPSFVKRISSLDFNNPTYQHMLRRRYGALRRAEMQDDYTGLGAIAWDGYATDPDPDIHKDIPMWLRIAAEAAGPILDVGCATGRVMLPLLEAGHIVDG